MDEQARARSKQRRAMAEELDRRERVSAKSLSDLQRAQANLAAQMRRMREIAIARKRAELSSQAATAAQAAAAAVAEASAAGLGAQDDPDAPPQVDAETLTLLKSSLQVRWSTDHAKHDSSSVRELFTRFGEVVHVSMRKPSSKAGPNRSAVVVMGTATAAASACKRAAATVRHPLLVTPLPKVADVDGLTVAAPGAAQAAAARLRRADIAAAAPAAPPGPASAAPQLGQQAPSSGFAAGVSGSRAGATSFPGASARPSSFPASFPSSFPGTAKPAADRPVPGADDAAGPGEYPLASREAGGSAAAPGEIGTGSGGAGEAGVQDEGARGQVHEGGSAGASMSTVGQGKGQSAAAKQLEREAIRAKLLAEAEAEDALTPE